MTHPGTSHYSHLFGPVMTWGDASGTFALRDSLPPREEIGNVIMVPYTGDGWVIIQGQDGGWYPPGGALEPGEDILDALQREMQEEVGAEVIDYTPFGAWEMYSSGDKPYRSHTPHPRFYIVAGYGPVATVSAPEPGDLVVAADVVPLNEALRRFRRIGRHDIADLYALVAEMRKKTT